MLIYHLASLVTQPLMMRPVILSTCKTIITPEKKGETETTRRKSQQVGWLHLLLKDLYHLTESQNSQITCREIHCAIIWEILTFSLWLFPFLALSLSGTPFLFCAMGIWDRGAGPISFSWAVHYKNITPGCWSFIHYLPVCDLECKSMWNMPGTRRNYTGWHINEVPTSLSGSMANSAVFFIWIFNCLIYQSEKSDTALVPSLSGTYYKSKILGKDYRLSFYLSVNQLAEL